jgi:hypothetical protein
VTASIPGNAESAAIVAVPSPEELAYARLLVEIETRKRYLAGLESERATLEVALSRFAVAVRARIGALKDEIKLIRQQLEEIRRRTIRLRGDPDADPVEVEREVAEELAARRDEARAEEEATRVDGGGEAPSPRPPRREAAIEAELQRLYRELAKRYHPDLAREPEERRRRAEAMLRINVAYRDRDLVTLQKLLLEAERAGPAAPLRLHRQKLAWAHREIARLDREIAELEARLSLLRRSDTYALWRNPDQSESILDDLEAKTNERLTRERGRLDEATTTYQRLLARRRRAQLLRERTADLRTGRVTVGIPVGAPTASD